MTSITRFLWRRPGRFAMLVAAWLVVRLLGVAAGLGLKYLFDRLDGGPSSVVWALAFGVVVAYLAQTITTFDFAIARLEPSYGYHLAGLLRINTLRAVLRRPATAVRSMPAGDIAVRFGRDVAELRTLPVGLASTVAQLVAGAVTVALMVLISPVTTIGVIVPLAGLLAASWAMNGRLRRYRQESRKAAAELGEHIVTCVRSAETVDTYGRIPQVVNRLRQLGKAREQLTVQDTTIGAVQASISQIGGAIAATAVMVIGAGELRSGAITVGDVALFVSLAPFVSDMLKAIGEILQRLRHARVSMDRLESLAGTSNIVAETPTYLTVPIPRPQYLTPIIEPLRSVRIRSISGRYLNGTTSPPIDLEILPRSLTIITGPVGVGKSTALRACVGVVDRASGEIVWNDQVVDDLINHMTPPRVAYVPQKPHLFSGTLADNITIGRRSPFTQADVAEAVADAGLAPDIEALPQGLATYIGVGGSRLSGGQVRRVALARALVRRPQVLLLDDIDASLDPGLAIEIWDRIRRRGFAIVAISHNPATIAAADNVVEMWPQVRQTELSDKGGSPRVDTEVSRASQLRECLSWCGTGLVWMSSSDVLCPMGCGRSPVRWFL